MDGPIYPHDGMTEEERNRARDANLAWMLGNAARAAAKPPKPWEKRGGAARTPKPVGPNERSANEVTFFQPEFNSWIAKNRDHPLFDKSRTQTFELKVSDGGTLNFDRVERHQDEAARRAATEDGCYHRIETAPHRFQTRKPWDCELVRNAQCFLAVMYHVKQRGNNVFYLIPFDAWRGERDMGGTSLSEERAGVIGTKLTL